MVSNLMRPRKKNRDRKINLEKKISKEVNAYT